MYDLLCGPAAWRRGHTEGVSPLLLQVENEYCENQRNRRNSRKVVVGENKKFCFVAFTVRNICLVSILMVMCPCPGSACVQSLC